MRARKPAGRCPSTAGSGGRGGSAARVPQAGRWDSQTGAGASSAATELCVERSLPACHVIACMRLSTVAALGPQAARLERSRRSHTRDCVQRPPVQDLVDWRFGCWKDMSYVSLLGIPPRRCRTTNTSRPRSLYRPRTHTTSPCAAAPLRATRTPTKLTFASPPALAAGFQVSGVLHQHDWR